MATVLNASGQPGGLRCRMACAPGALHCRALVRTASGRADARAHGALARLVEQAWPEVHAFVRRQGVGTTDAEDLTQAYFAQFIEKGYLRRLGSWNGCIRPFFLTSLRHFLSNARDHARALKRGGRTRTVSLDEAFASGRPGLEPIDATTPESLLASAERLRAMQRAIAAVRGEARRDGDRRRLDRLLSHLERGDVDNQEIARSWGVSPAAVRVALHRLRRRLARALAEVTIAAAPDATGVNEARSRDDRHGREA